jgi:hypothetical protein
VMSREPSLSYHLSQQPTHHRRDLAIIKAKSS